MQTSLFSCTCQKKAVRVCQNYLAHSFFCVHFVHKGIKTNKIPTFSSKDFAKSQNFCNFAL